MLINKPFPNHKTNRIASLSGSIFSLIIPLLLISCGQEPSRTLSLEGTWSMQLDSADVGLQEQWFSKDLNDQVKLPGSLKENDKGYEVTADVKWTGSIYDSSWYFNPKMGKYRQPGNVKFPFWLTPNKYYVGPAWYSKDIEVPSDWENKRIVLFLERAHFETMVWVDGKEVGQQNSLVAPHEYDLPPLNPGPHQLTIRVDNRIKEINVGPDSHSISDHTQGNWNGITGKMELRATDPVWMQEVQVFPDLSQYKVRVELKIQNLETEKRQAKIQFKANAFNTSSTHAVNQKEETLTVEPGENTFSIDYPMGENFLSWDEFDPALYRMEISMETQEGETDQKEVEFGMRDFEIEGTRFSINDRTTFLRGNVDCAAFPLTGYAPMDLDFWVKYMKTLQKYRINHVRFHSWCPPEAAFKAADRVGIYLQPEGPSWANHGTSLGDGRPIDQYIYDETERMREYYGNYASFVMMAYGNEPAGRNQARYLGDFVKYWQKRDDRRVYTGASVGMSWPWVPESEFIVKSGPRNIPWNRKPQTEWDHYAKIKDVEAPYLAHENGQYCVYPNFEEIDKYTGVYKAKNFEIFQETLEENHMGDQSQDFLMASGKLQALAYKHEIEGALRTPGFAGYQLLSINDFPGQGTALVGFLDVFYDEKGYLTAEEFRRFHNTTVPLARFPKFVFKQEEKAEISLEMFHFGEAPMEKANITWNIKDNAGNVIKSGEFTGMEIPIGNNTAIGNLNLDFNEFPNEAAKYTLEVGIEGTEFFNDWDFWVYPTSLPKVETNNIYITDQLDNKAKSILDNGGKVLMKAAGKVEFGKDVAMYFKPVFWNTSWFQMRPPHTLGILCQSDHPVFDQFPTDYYSDLQWWELLSAGSWTISLHK